MNSQYSVQENTQFQKNRYFSQATSMNFSNVQLFVDTKQPKYMQNTNNGYILQDAEETISTKSSVDSAEIQDKATFLSSQQSSAQKLKMTQFDNIMQDNDSLQEIEQFQPENQLFTPQTFSQYQQNFQFNNLPSQSYQHASPTQLFNKSSSSQFCFNQQCNYQSHNQVDDVRNHINLDFIDEYDGVTQNNNSNDITNQFSFPSPLNQSQQKMSPVLYINNINLQVVSLKAIYHIFGNFGNIKFMIYQKSKQNLLVEFQTMLHAVQAKEYLNNKLIGGKKIKIFFSHYESLQSKIQSLNHDNEILLEGNQFDYRYKEVIDINQINPPSNTIHISNLPPQVFYSDVLQQIFGKAGKIQKIQFYVKNNIRNMCFIKFSTVEEGIAAMGLHQYPINNRKIYISFTRVKI